jgi:hypothetical protein
MKQFYLIYLSILFSLTLTPLLGQEKGICPELGKFASALTKHQQVQVKEMLKTSGLLDATGLSKQDQEDLVIEYDEQRNTASAHQGFMYQIYPAINRIDITRNAPTITLGSLEVAALRNIFTEKQMKEWVVKNAGVLAHEITHLLKCDSLYETSTGRGLLATFKDFPWDAKKLCLRNPYPLFFYPTFIEYLVDSVENPSTLKSHSKHFIVGHPLPSVRDILEQRSSAHPHHLKAMRSAAAEYAQLYQTTQLIQDFWQKSQATQHTNHPDTCLKKLTDTLWATLQNATWLSHIAELQADKNSIQSILKLTCSTSTKQQMLQSYFNILKAIDQKNKNHVDLANTLGIHPPFASRYTMIEIGMQMLKEGQTPELTEKLNQLAVPSYLKIPKEPKRTPVEQP